MHENNKTYSTKNGVTTPYETPAPSATPVIVALPDVVLHRLVRALAESWERRISDIETRLERTDYVQGVRDAEKRCLRELRAEMEKCPNAKVSGSGESERG